MPLNISKVGKILKTLNRVHTTSEFNSTLPVKITVKQELSPIRYLIDLGKKEIETKSNYPLIVGKKYFAQLKEFNTKIQISNLREIPKIAEMLEKIEFKDKIIHFTKQETLHHLANANNKLEFVFYTNILLALNEKIHHLIINEKKKALMQYKYQKNRVKFYALFNHLGEIEGEITTDTLSIYSPYDATLNLINRYAHKLNLKLILTKKEVKPFVNFENNLLNIKA